MPKNELDTRTAREELSPMDELFNEIESHGSTISVGRMYPSPGDYHVTSVKVHPYKNQKTEKRSVRVECLIDKGPKALIGKTMSFFLPMDNTALAGHKTPLSYSTDRLYRLFEDEHTKNGQLVATVQLRQYLDKFNSGHSFVIRRTAQETKKGGIMPNDELLCFEAYDAIEAAADKTPEEAPATAAQVGDF